MKWKASLCKSQQTWMQEPMESWIPELWDTPSPPALQASRCHLSWGMVTGTVTGTVRQRAHRSGENTRGPRTRAVRREAGGSEHLRLQLGRPQPCQVHRVPHTEHTGTVMAGAVLRDFTGK